MGVGSCQELPLILALLDPVSDPHEFFIVEVSFSLDFFKLVKGWLRRFLDLLLGDIMLHVVLLDEYLVLVVSLVFMLTLVLILMLVVHGLDVADGLLPVSNIIGGCLRWDEVI